MASTFIDLRSVRKHELREFLKGFEFKKLRKNYSLFHFFKAGKRGKLGLSMKSSSAQKLNHFSLGLRRCFMPLESRAEFEWRRVSERERWKT